MDFLGREHESDQLSQWVRETEGSWLTVIYGRRRIGKTRLVEEAFRDVPILKFEGLEGQPTATQQRHFLDRLSELSGRAEHKLIKTSNWIDILKLLSRFLEERWGRQPVAVFFDELPWMACGRTRLVSNLKYVWDNHFTKRNRVHLILCGSVCSFLVKKVISSSALYGRIHQQINLGPLSLPEIRDVFRPRRSLREVVELYMAVGGVPQYLEMVDPTQSVRANLEKLCFTRGAYLVEEFDRLFASHFGTNRHYRKILQHLARHSYASRDQLQSTCNLGSGGRISDYLADLETAGFIERYAPIHKPDSPKINRYRIADPYLVFYFRFIAPVLGRIRQSKGRPSLTKYVPDNRFDVWRGQAFEYLCYRHSQLIAEKLGFGAVSYRCGPWFQRGEAGHGAQIDLVFQRADRVITLCEIKFQSASIGKSVIEEVEQRRAAFPNPKRHTIETVLITASPATDDLRRERYFNRILSLEDLFG